MVTRVRSPLGRSLHQTGRLPRAADLSHGLCALGIDRLWAEELGLCVVIWEEQEGQRGGGV